MTDQNSEPEYDKAEKIEEAVHCPFCGCNFVYWDVDYGMGITCMICGITILFSCATKEEMLTIWNKRPKENS